ncbi:hypothetical protein LB557_17215 [Mesorhizobium sp. BR115XR7A]|uniref:DUF6894 family protein n=1 Tax=Mesorhizobium sp. BR115XR7A TaxID=2876645 RepID=UPI001CCF6BB8|nr:hypothetical protein [Mesorhizobium sp. BR115XR7A]MBZ9907749.1 hypothetical protein [Mesorhizobium sp. BR115XR7A]MBZ9929048.1 hypothetical protein [Mesorhizobium sp. BR1-1-5]
MARYFFDTGDSDAVIRDEAGIECDGVEEARREAMEGLIDLAREFLNDFDGQQLFVQVRDEKGNKLAKLSLSLRMQIGTDELTDPRLPA